MRVSWWPCGGLITIDPIIAPARRSAVPNSDPLPNNNLGLLTTMPEAFANRTSLTFLTVAWSHEQPHMIESLQEDIARIATSHPDARICMCANTEREHELYQAAGIRSIMGPKEIFTRLDRFVVPPSTGRKEFDAVYVARFADMKRHELASAVGRLMCIYDDVDAPTLAAMCRKLPGACFANHAGPDGKYRRIIDDQFCAALDRAAVGLCLSEREGMMRASVEYQLCGLPVVSTPNTGGRDHYLRHRFAVHADADAGAIADAVERLKARRFDPHEVRANIVALIEHDRARFLFDAQRVANEIFGARTPQFGSFECFDRVDLQRHRHIDQMMEPTLIIQAGRRPACRARARWSGRCSGGGTVHAAGCPSLDRRGRSGRAPLRSGLIASR